MSTGNRQDNDLVIEIAKQLHKSQKPTNTKWKVSYQNEKTIELPSFDYHCNHMLVPDR